MSVSDLVSQTGKSVADFQQEIAMLTSIAALFRPSSHLVSSDDAALTRTEALARFLKLQAQGLSPCMVEEASGVYRVFVSDAGGSVQN